MEIIQVGINTADIAGSLRLYAEAFGFENGGGQALWGETLKVHGLDPGDRALMWWMVGSEEFCQLEFFHHSKPGQRPLSPDWRPSDIGWVRMGLRVPDLDRAIAIFDRDSIAVSGRSDRGGVRRLGFRDPFAGIAVEVEEDSRVDGPQLRYVTSSVSDLPAALTYYRDVVGLDIAPLEELHLPEDEAVWGLPGAQREGFIVSAGPRCLEIVRYSDPLGRPRPADHRICDQGIMNVALGSRTRQEVESLLTRLGAAGYHPPSIFRHEDIVAAYIVDAERELELAAIPRSMDKAVGFERSGPFFT